MLYETADPQPAPVVAKPVVSRTAMYVALGGVGFLAMSAGLRLLTSLITALAAFNGQLVIRTAVVFGGWIAAQVPGSSSHLRARVGLRSDNKRKQASRVPLPPHRVHTRRYF